MCGPYIIGRGMTYLSNLESHGQKNKRKQSAFPRVVQNALPDNFKKSVLETTDKLITNRED